MYRFALSSGSVTSVCVCDPRHVCTAATCLGFLTSVMSKMRTPRNRSALTVSWLPLRSAVDPAAGLLDRHEEEIAVHRHVALTAWAHHGSQQSRIASALDVVGVEPVIVADEQMMAAEREIRVRKTQTVRQRRDRGPASVGAAGAWPSAAVASPLGAVRLGCARAESDSRPAPSDRRSLPAWAGSRCAPCCARPRRRPGNPGLSPTRGSGGRRSCAAAVHHDRKQHDGETQQTGGSACVIAEAP